MKICWSRFNLYLCLALALGMTLGCKTEAGKRKKVLATLRLHQEVNPDATGRSEMVVVHRDPFIQMNLEKNTFLTEANIKGAKVVDVLGGFVIHVQYDQEGAWLLEQYSSAARGRHIAVFSQFQDHPGEKVNKGRWLTALKINNHITDGLLIFTPDVTREEADQIVLGLNNVQAKTKAGQEPKW